jgi:hypothetical protein
LKDKITTPDIDWEAALELIKNDPRFKNDAMFPDKKEKLFKSHKHFLYVERREASNFNSSKYIL